MNPRLIELVILAMDSRAFEDLLFSLVRAEEPTARQLKPPDAGRDTIVPTTKTRREQAWQAKHHTSGISWSKCEESLKQSIEKRDPETVTFVFPVNMTEGKEEGLKELRKRYPKVDLPEPWTMATLLEKLAATPDIRRQHIDAAIGVDHKFAQEMLEKGTQLREGWDERLSAALRGPLAVLGYQADVEEAQAMMDERRFPEASERFEEIATATADRMPAVADSLLMVAARAAAEGDDRPRAAELYLLASRRASTRGDSAAGYAAFRASWNLPQDQHWRSAAAMSRAAWQENPQEAIPVLRDAFDRALEAQDPDGVLEWATAVCEVLAAEKEWAAIEEIAGAAIEILEPVERLGPRLDLELDLLSARSELGQEVEGGWNELLLAPVGRNDEAAALIRARWGMASARRGRVDFANARFREAADSWRLVGDAEEEIGEALLSQDVLAQLLGGRALDQAGRIAIAELRGRMTTPTVLADRKESEGLRAWLAERGWDARRNLLLSWSIHRRAGHLAGCLRLAEALNQLFTGAEEWDEALAWAIRCGKQQTARELAAKLDWPEVRDRANPARPPWEQGAAFEAVAVAGASATEEEIGRLEAPLLAVARDHAENENTTLRPGPAARRALATLLCGISEEHFPAALDEVIYETETTPFPPAICVNGLLLATEAGLCEEGKLIVEVFSDYGHAHLPGYPAVLELIGKSDSARKSAIALAGESVNALLLCAWADVPDGSPEIAKRAADAVAHSLSDDADPSETFSRQDRGRLARWAASEDQLLIGEDLIETLISPSEIGVHRYEAAKGLLALAERLDPRAASDFLDRLTAASEAIATASVRGEMASHSNPVFARMHMRSPAEADEVLALALQAKVELAVRSDRLADVRDRVVNGLADRGATIRRAALNCVITHPDLAEIDLRDWINDEDPLARALALKGLGERGELGDQDLALLASSAPGAPLAVRSSALRIARKDPKRYEMILGVLAADPHVFVRGAAQVAHGKSQADDTDDHRVRPPQAR